MRHTKRYVILTLAAVVVMAVVSGCLHFLSSRYFRYLGAVDNVIEQLPQAEASPPEVVAELIRVVKKASFHYWVERNLIAESDKSRMRNLEWQSRLLVWHLLLPTHLSDSQYVALYCHFMTCEKGTGLEYGAKHYFSKRPEELSLAEAAGLLAISESPQLYSPTEHPDNYERRVKRILEIYAQRPNESLQRTATAATPTPTPSGG